MQIYISCDLEGIAGIVDYKQQCLVSGKYYDQARELCTMELNAAVEGAIAGGASEIYAWDSHGDFPGCLDYSLLHPGCQLIIGAGNGEPFGLDETFDGLIQIGLHARQDTPGAVLGHGGWELNDIKLGEIGLNALIAGNFGIPCILVSGDRAAAEETKKLLPYTETAVVKEAVFPKIYNLETQPMMSLSPENSRKLIREKAKLAMKKIKSISPLKIVPPFKLKITFDDERKTEKYFKNYPEAIKLNHLQLVFESDDLMKLPFNDRII